MAYIGNSPANVGNYQEVDALTGFNGTETSFALTANSKAISPAKSGQLLVSINGVMQEPDDSGTNGFKVVGSNIIFSGAPASGDSSWLMFQGQNVDVGTPSDATVGTAQLSATGTASSSTYLRGDNSWGAVSVTPTVVSDQANTSTGYFDLPSGTTAQRPSTATTGMLRYNTTIGYVEQYASGSWSVIAAAPTISSISYVGTTTAASLSGGETITLTGINFSTTGTSLTLDGVAVGSYSVVSTTSITFTSPVKTAADYDVIFTNPTGLASTVTITYSANPSWTNTTDTVIAAVSQGSTVNITSNTASEGADAITYSEVTTVLTGGGAGEMGLSLNSSTGAITGTAPSVSSNTTYTFTLKAVDAENQVSNRQFKIVVNVNYFGSGSDGSLST